MQIAGSYRVAQFVQASQVINEEKSFTLISMLVRCNLINTA